tara:strand:+ start:152 stop:622 length:471 start_codon:yes stop_codon:yes gene_type:complete
MSKVDRAFEKAEKAVEYGRIGYAFGGGLGAAAGATLGLIIGDDTITFPLDMICIPAYQAYMIQGSPSMEIYVRSGETLVPTGGNVQDVAVGEAQAAELPKVGSASKPRKKTTAYQRRYKKAFKQVSPTYKKKDGKWKKDGFQKAVRAAHKEARGKK